MFSISYMLSKTSLRESRAEWESRTEPDDFSATVRKTEPTHSASAYSIYMNPVHKMYNFFGKNHV